MPSFEIPSFPRSVGDLFDNIFKFPGDGSGSVPETETFPNSCPAGLVPQVLEIGGSGTGAPKPLGLGSTGKTQATNLKEQLAMEQAMSNPSSGRILPVPMTDPRWPASDGWVKKSQNINGVEIHYVQNSKTGAVDDYKFK